MFRTKRSKQKARERGRALARAFIEQAHSQVRWRTKLSRATEAMLHSIREAQKSLPHMDYERKVRWIGNMMALAGIIDPGW